MVRDCHWSESHHIGIEASRIVSELRQTVSRVNHIVKSYEWNLSFHFVRPCVLEWIALHCHWSDCSKLLDIRMKVNHSAVVLHHTFMGIASFCIIIWFYHTVSLQSIVSDSYRKRMKRDSQRTDPCCVEAEENSEHLGHQFCTFQKFPLFPHFLLETNVWVNDTFRNRVPHLLHFQLLILVNYFHIPIIPTFPEFHKKYPPPSKKRRCFNSTCLPPPPSILNRVKTFRLQHVQLIQNIFESSCYKSLHFHNQVHKLRWFTTPIHFLLHITTHFSHSNFKLFSWFRTSWKLFVTFPKFSHLLNKISQKIFYIFSRDVIYGLITTWIACI